jgi:hypothetical protein
VRETIPLSERRIDWLFMGFWVVNLTFITYVVDLEQLVIEDPTSFEYPIWPPAPLVDLVHWWGTSFDPVQYARPPWWRATIWIDVLLFGPFYAAAIYAFWKGRDWIAKPALVWSGLMFANVTIILFEEVLGPHATPALGVVLLANLPWVAMPIATIARLWPAHPFTREARQPTERAETRPAVGWQRKSVATRAPGPANRPRPPAPGA